ncbi:MAG: LPD1 domain-containing protein, partial [Lentisphaeria bacterium]
ITTMHHSTILPGENAAGKQNHVGWRLEAAAPAPAPVKLELAAGQTARMATRAEVEAAAPPAPAGLTGQEIKAAPEGARINVRGKDGLKATLVKRGDAWHYETAAGPVGDYGTQTVLDILQGIREEGGESEPGWARMPEGKDKPTPPAVTVPAGPAKDRAAKTAPPQLGLFSSATTAKVQEARERAQQVAKKAAETGKPVPQAALDLQEQALAELKDREVDAQAATVARRVRGLESKRSPVEIKAEAGEHVWGSRKDLAALVHSADDLAKLTPEEQSKLVTKARLVEPWEAEDLLAEGWEPQAVLARHAIEACIAPAAGDSLEARQAYMNGVDYWAHTFDACRTFQDVQEALVDLNRLTDGRVELASMEKPELDTLLWKYAEHEAQRAGKTLASREQIQALSTAYDAASSIYRDLHNTVQSQINEYKRQFWTEYTHEKRNPSSADFWERWVVKKPLPPELVAGQEKVAALEAAKKRAYQALQDAGGDLIMRADESAAVAWANGLPSGDVSGMHIRAADGSYSMKFYKRDAKLAEAGWKVGGNQYQQMVAALGERMVRLVNSGQGGGGGWSSFQEKATPKAWLDVLATVKAMRKPKEKGGPAPTAEDHVQMMHEHLKSKKRGGGKGGPGWLRDVPDTVVRKGGREIGKSTPAEIAREFGLKNVQFGNWVSEEDAKVHVPAAHAAFADLQDLLGADSPGQVSMNGRLSLGIGARGSGNARAHYETQGEIINLTKISGGGALAHEWAHALDNLLSKAGNPESTQAHRFVSDGQDKGVDPVVAKAFHSAVQEILQGEFYQDAKAMGSAYWRRPHEMFARAFEAWAEDELARRGQENSYLVAGTRKVYQTRKFASQADAAKGRSAQPYPQGAKRAAIGEKIGALVAALRETGALKKALEALDARARGPRLTVPAGELQKAGGPYIGPKGGKWEDPKHTRHWNPQEHQGGAAQGDLFGEKKPEPKLEVPATQPEPPAVTVPADQPAALPARTLDTMSDAIALGSPSGRQSQASQQAAQARLGEALFGPGGLKAPQQAQPSTQEVLRRQAKGLRDLAARGVGPRKHLKEAERLEGMAEELAAVAAGPGTEKFDRAVIRAEREFREWVGASGSGSEKRGDE